MKKLFLPLCVSAFLLLLTLSAFAQSDTVVYLKSGASGDGSSPESPVATLSAAYGALDLSKDCTIVLCGSYTQGAVFSYGQTYSGSVTFTSVYGGRDYRETGAVWQFSACRFIAYGETRFENMDFYCRGTNLLFVAQFHPVTVGENVTMTGAGMTGATMGTSFAIVGGCQSGVGDAVVDSDKDTCITVLSGSKINIMPFSRGIAGNFGGTAHITVGGNASVSVLHGISYGAKSSGSTSVVLKDDAAIIDFYGCMEDATAKRISFDWQGGSIENFSWGAPGKTLTVREKTVLTASAAAQKAANYAAVAAAFDEVRQPSAAAADKPRHTLQTVYLADGGTGDGTSALSPVGSLEAAYDALDLSADAKVVLCGNFTQDADFVYAEDFAGKVTITAQSGAAFTAGAHTFACTGETVFENVHFVFTGKNYVLAGQFHPVTVGKGCRVTGTQMNGLNSATAFTVLGGYVAGVGDAGLYNGGDTSVTVLSGELFYLVPFSRMLCGYYPGTGYIKVGGDAKVGVLNGGMANYDGSVIGSTILTLEGDAEIGNVYVATQDMTMDAFTLHWNAGRITGVFDWVCRYTKDKTLTVRGDRTLIASDAAKKNANYADIAALFPRIVAQADAPVVCERPLLRTDYNCAALLHALHLLAGRGKTADGEVDFDFKGGLTRVDGVVQIIRFLGAETAVTSGSHPHPFEDVPAWADAYVGYAYRHGIISGRSATRFDPAGSMDEAQFLTLLLRAVGYSDAAGEFVWNDPFPLAKRVGMTQDSAAVGAFTRADAFRICASALYVTASDRELVYQRLIRAGVFTAAEFEQAVASAEKVLAPQSKTQVLSTQAYLDKTTAGFLGQLVGVFTGYEFVKKNGDYAVGLPDAWFALLRGPYSGDRLPYSKHEAKLVYNEETKRYESWMDDDYSIDILNQYILRDMRETYGTFASKVITDGWVKYDVYDMGGGNRTVGAYALMKNRHYLPMFAGSAEYGNRYNYCLEPCIGNETLGMSAAGMPNKAVDLAEIFANVTGDTDNTEWTKFLAALYAMAYFEDDMPTLICRAAEVFGEGVYEREVVDGCIALWQKYPDNWRAAAVAATAKFRRSHDRMDDAKLELEYNVNSAFVLLGLLYGKNDYETAAKIISLAGYDGDCTAAIGLGILGIAVGMDGLPEVVRERIWQDGNGIIINEAVPGTASGYWMYLAGLPREMKIADIIDLYRENFEWLLLANGGSVENGTYTIPYEAFRAPRVLAYTDFEDGTLADCKTAGKVALTGKDTFEGKYAAQIFADGDADGELYRTFVGLTVGKTYRLTAYIRTSAQTEANLFCRDAAKEVATADVCNAAACYVRRSLVFTATAPIMEIGVRMPAAHNDNKYVLADHLTLSEITETTAGTVTKETTASENSVSLVARGDGQGEVLLRLTFANPGASVADMAVTVNGESFHTAPLYRTGVASASAADVVYVPVLLTGKDGDKILLSFDTDGVEILDARLVTVTDRY